MPYLVCLHRQVSSRFVLLSLVLFDPWERQFLWLLQHPLSSPDVILEWTLILFIQPGTLLWSFNWGFMVKTFYKITGVTDSVEVLNSQHVILHGERMAKALS